MITVMTDIHIIAVAERGHRCLPVFTPRDITDTTEEVWPSQDDRGEEHQDLNVKRERERQDLNVNEKDMNVNEEDRT